MLRVISITFGHTTELEVSIGSFMLQTNPNWTLEIVHDGPAPNEVYGIMHRYSRDHRISFICTSQRNGLWGHQNRGAALENLECDPNDFVLLTNGDNYMCPQLVEQALDAVKDNIGIVMWDCIHSHLNYGYHRSQLFEGGLDMSSFCVRADIAKKVGFKYTHFSADGAYAVDCAKECAERGLIAVHINKALFMHN